MTNEDDNCDDFDGFHEVEVKDEDFSEKNNNFSVEEEKSTITLVGLDCPIKVTKSLKEFFKDLHWAIGGKIPEETLISKKYLNLVINIGNAGFVQAIDLAYALIKKHANDYGSFSRSGPYVEDLEIEMCLYVVRRAGNLHIPQGYIGGIFLIYLELCEGVRLL